MVKKILGNSIRTIVVSMVVCSLGLQQSVVAQEHKGDLMARTVPAATTGIFLGLAIWLSIQAWNAKEAKKEVQIVQKGFLPSEVLQFQLPSKIK